MPVLYCYGDIDRQSAKFLRFWLAPYIRPNSSEWQDITIHVGVGVHAGS